MPDLRYNCEQRRRHAPVCAMEGGLDMRKNFGAKTWVYPMPVLIIATYDADGNPIGKAYEPT